MEHVSKIIGQLDLNYEYVDELHSLVDGVPLRTFLCDPMHTLRSSGYTLCGTFLGKFQLGDQFISLIYTLPHTNTWVLAGHPPD